MSESLEHPTDTMPFRSAVGHRLRRIYLALLVHLLVAWVARITVFEPGRGWKQTAAIPGLGGESVVPLVAVFYLLVAGIAVRSAQETEIREGRE